MSEQVPSNSLFSRVHKALGLAMKHMRCDRECGGSHYKNGRRESCGCGKAQDHWSIASMFTDEEWMAIHAGRTPDEPPDDCEAEATRDMLTDARLELDALRSALGVDYEPHQSLHERMLDAANHKRVERGLQGPCPSCGARWVSAELSSSQPPPADLPLARTLRIDRIPPEEFARIRAITDGTVAGSTFRKLLWQIEQLEAGVAELIAEPRAAPPPAPAPKFKVGEKVWGGCAEREVLSIHHRYRVTKTVLEGCGYMHMDEDALEPYSSETKPAAPYEFVGMDADGNPVRQSATKGESQ